MVYFRCSNLFRVTAGYRNIRRMCSEHPLNMTMPKKLILYGDVISPPVRFVMMTASVLEIELDYQIVNLFKGENVFPAFTKMNPLRKVPVLETDGAVICDSHAISLYLCDISKNDCLYPHDHVTRAKINQMMFFNCGTLFPIDSFIYTEYFNGSWNADETKIKQWHLALDHLNYQLSRHTWLGSNKLSLADLCCGATVSSMELLLPKLERHAMVNKWLQMLNKLPCFEINTRGLKRLKSFVDSHSNELS